MYFNNNTDVLSQTLTIAKQKAVIYALIISLLGSALLPSIASAGDFPSKALLCTSQGYQWVVIADESPSDRNTENRSNHCVYCFLSDDSDQEEASDAAALAYGVIDGSLGVRRSYSHLITFSFRASLQPRAPPIFI